ncbi:DNA oxidative demethylase AlkB [Thermomonas haemolytica]|uniref:Alkylated DNA repair protein (DNA oxidative demethylase) n=1 Tax=Thermomonas haemolytica TaxID=141949 RepID=A0A4R3MX17_9GAMM|nr:DNA oxidative demethylase AlkB [Thermomonas haemolytica]TCT20061.1 alkylated DNA repair protein (DNA oxidative demethylase) [Thermomonas haemolytica]TNY29631.1 alpha-ketoglutarate-dependent dioxygenase AlkB [Thermomonas haemolytica]
MSDLFASAAVGGSSMLGPQARVLHGFALQAAPALLHGIAQIAAQAPFRRLSTPGGRRIQVEMTNCGRYGWYSDRRGYRYEAIDPDSGRAWPAMPDDFLQLAVAAAAAAGFPGYRPDACLINRYRPGAGMGLHQDRDEEDTRAPIVSVSLGLPAVFLFGGMTRGEPTVRVPLAHGDVAVWGGVDRMRFHGVRPLAPGHDPATGDFRLNLTFRKVR